MLAVVFEVTPERFLARALDGQIFTVDFVTRDPVTGAVVGEMPREARERIHKETVFDITVRGDKLDYKFVK